MEPGDPHIGQTFGAFVVEELLGEGGMGTVYIARHDRTGRRYALKLLHSATPGSTLALRGLARFRREARALSGLRHAHVVAIHDFDVSPSGEPYLVMDLLEGESLADRIEVGEGLPWGTALRWFEQIAAALTALHELDVIHRDIKPSNVLLTQLPGGEEMAVLIDFGLVKELRSSSSTVTAPDVALGTPAYMPPEQARGEVVDARTDVYALGIVLYEMLAGRPPFVGPTPTAVIAQALVDPPMPIHTFAHVVVPEGIDDVLGRALAKEREERYPDIATFVAAVRELVFDESSDAQPRTRVLEPSSPARPAVVSGRRPLALGLAVGALGLAAGLAAFAMLEPPESSPPAGSAPLSEDVVPAVPVAVALVPETDAAPAGVEAPDEPSETEAPPPAAVTTSTSRPRVAREPEPRGARRIRPASDHSDPPAIAPPPRSPPPPVAPASPSVAADPLARARDAASRRAWGECTSALSSQPSIERRALGLFMTCATNARERAAQERGCREIERLLLFDHPWHRRCQQEILGGGSPAPRPTGGSPATVTEREAGEMRQRGDYAGCARRLVDTHRSYSMLMMRLDCAELSRQPRLLRLACRQYIDARIPAQTRFNALCEQLFREAAGR